MIKEFKYLFQEISFAYEGKEPYITDDFIVFYKTTIFKNGTIERKGQIDTWDTSNPTLWPKVLAIAKLLIESPAEKVLFGPK